MADDYSEDDDEDETTTTTTTTLSSSVPTASEVCRPTNKCCCCCGGVAYNPFDDHSPEARIKDLPFALKKLAVMKCQMKKWMLERLELESQARSMRLALQDYGNFTKKTLPLFSLFIYFLPVMCFQESI